MDRIKEPSTWAGLGLFFQVLKAFFPQHAMYADALTGGAAAVAAALPERAR